MSKGFVFPFTRGMRTLACALLVAGMFAPGTTARSQELTEIKIAGGPADDTTPALYAIKAGLFRQAGINAEITSLRSGSAIAAAVAGGSAQFGVSSLMPLITGYSHGVKLPIVAPGTVYDASIRNGLMVIKNDSPIKTGRDLNGQTIAAPSLGEVGAISMLSWIDRNGGDSKTVKMVEIPYPAITAALDEGRVSAGTLNSPILEQSLETGKVRVLANAKDAIAKRFLNSAWFTTADYAAAHPDIVQKFALVMRNASTFANANHAATVDLIAAFTSVDPATVARSVRPIWGDRISKADLQPLVDAAAKYHLIERSFDGAQLVSPTVLQIFR